MEDQERAVAWSVRSLLTLTPEPKVCFPSGVGTEQRVAQPSLLDLAHWHPEREGVLAMGTTGQPPSPPGQLLSCLWRTMDVKPAGRT